MANGGLSIGPLGRLQCFGNYCLPGFTVMTNKKWVRIWIRMADRFDEGLTVR